MSDRAGPNTPRFQTSAHGAPVFLLKSRRLPGVCSYSLPFLPSRTASSFSRQVNSQTGHYRIPSLPQRRTIHIIFNTNQPTNPQIIKMRFTAAAAAAGFAATASASVMGHHDNSTAPAAPVYVTDVVTAYTTYCPEPTEIEQNGKTYTVTEATTLTISDCEGGCTVTTPVYSSLVTSCSTWY